MSEMITDPSVINMLGAEIEGSVAPAAIIETSVPKDTTVFLPGGFINSDGVLVKHAEIRELNGADEEAISRANTHGSALNLILSKGLVSLGDEPATAASLDGLLAGDRDAILLAIRKATFGKTAELQTMCTACMKMSDVTVDLDNDIKTVELENPIVDRRFTVEGKAGAITVSLPIGMTQKKITEATDKSAAELVTMVLAGCIASINDEPSLGRSTALSLGVADREMLMQEISTRNPGPRLAGVVKACEACGNDLRISLSLATLFRL
jgi:hypothetical protein